MAVTAHVFPEFSQDAYTKILSLNGTDTVKAALYNGATPTFSSLYSVVTKANWESTTGYSEITGTGYTALGMALSSVTVSTSGLVTTLTASNPSWTTATFTAQQALFYDSTASNDVICYWDFGAGVAVSAGTFTLTINASGLVTATAS